MCHLPISHPLCRFSITCYLGLFINFLCGCSGLCLHTPDYSSPPLYTLSPADRNSGPSLYSTPRIRLLAKVSIFCSSPPYLATSCNFVKITLHLKHSVNLYMVITCVNEPLSVIRQKWIFLHSYQRNTPISKIF